MKERREWGDGSNPPLSIPDSMVLSVNSDAAG